MSPYPPAPARAIPALPVHKTVLRDGTAATIYPVASASALSPSLLAFLARTFNDELERGQTYPLEGPVDDDAFVAYWFAAFAAVILAGTYMHHRRDREGGGREWRGENRRERGGEERKEKGEKRTRLRWHR